MLWVHPEARQLSLVAAVLPFHECQNRLGTAPSQCLPSSLSPSLLLRQYLTDMYAVHAVLEESLASAADAEAADLAAMAALAAPGRQRHERLLAALELFGLEAGLARSVALLQDWRRLRAVGTQQPSCASGQQEQQELEHQQEGQQPGSGGGKGGHAASPAAATGHAAAYAAYIASLARLRGAAEGPDEEEQVSSRLSSCVFVAGHDHSGVACCCCCSSA